MTAWASKSQHQRWSCKRTLKLFIAKDGIRAPARMDTTVEARVGIPDAMKERGYAIYTPFCPALA